MDCCVCFACFLKHQVWWSHSFALYVLNEIFFCFFLASWDPEFFLRKKIVFFHVITLFRALKKKIISYAMSLVEDIGTHLKKKKKDMIEHA